METVQREEYNEQGKELREHGSAAFPIAWYSGDWRETSVPLHWHSELEVGFVTGGCVTLVVGREKRILHRGEGFFINSGIPHAILSANGAESSQRSLVFDPILVGGRPGSIFWQRYVQPILAAAAMPWIPLREERTVEKIRSAWEYCREAGEDYELEVRYALSGLLAAVKGRIPAEHPHQDRRITRDNERIRMMLGYIQNHYTEDVTMDQIASSAMISASEALRCFHNTIGMTPIQCLKHFRIQQAAALLRSSDRKISEIGEACGFQEMSYFARAFRELMGMTPSQYRKKHHP